jgi:hypothetical protein
MALIDGLTRIGWGPPAGRSTTQTGSLPPSDGRKLRGTPRRRQHPVPSAVLTSQL